MALEDLLLRIVSNPDLDAKGSQLTWEEGDGNIIVLYTEIASQRLSSYIDDYDNTVTYDDEVKNFVTYDGKTWKYIHATPAAGITPGTDPTRWTMVYVADLGHKKNQDTALDEGGDNEVSASEIREFIDAAGTPLFKTKVNINSSKILTWNSVPVPLITHPGGAYAGKKIVITDCQLSNNMEDSPASTPYATFMTVQVYTDGATKNQFTFVNGLNATIARSVSGQAQQATAATDTQLIEDADIMSDVAGGEPTGGDYDVDIDLTYKFI